MSHIFIQNFHVMYFEILSNDVLHMIMQFVGDDRMCQIPLKIVQQQFDVDIIRKRLQNENYPEIHIKYYQQYLLCKTVQNIRIDIDKQRTIYTKLNRRKKRTIPKRSCKNFFPQKKNTYKTIFNNIETRVLKSLDYEINGEYVMNENQLENIYNETYYKRISFLSTNNTFTFLDLYFIRQSIVWIKYILIKQQQQKTPIYWNKFENKDIIKSLQIINIVLQKK